MELNVKRRCYFFLLMWLSVIVCFPLVLLAQTETDSSSSILQDTEPVGQKAKNSEDLFEMSFEELMEMRIITAAKTPEEVGDIPASVIIVTRRDIERYGYATLTEILENIPGLYAIDDYSFQGANFGVRGFWSGVANDNIMILVNGIQQVYDPGSNYPLAICSVPVEAIDRIDIIRGPMSVVYGSGAFFGVINIITDATSANNPVESLNIATGALGTEKTGSLLLRLAGQEGEFHYVFNGSIYKTHGIDEPLSRMMSQPEKLLDYKLPLDRRTGGQLEWQRKYFDFSGHFKGLHLQVEYTNSKQESYFLIPSFSTGNTNRLESTRLSLSYRKNWSNTFAMEAKCNYSFLRDWYKMDYWSPTFYGIQEIESHAFEMEFNTFFKPSPRLDVTTGLYYRAITDVSNHYDLPSFQSPTLVDHFYYLAEGDNIETQAIFMQATFKPSQKLSLVGGVRLEQMPAYSMAGLLRNEDASYSLKTDTFEQEKIEIIPRFAAIYKMNSKNIIKLLYGKAINRSSFLQNQRNILVSHRGALKPERIQTLELNVMSSFSPAITLNAGLFRNILENLVTRVVEFDSQEQYTTWSDNAGKMVTNGLELTLQCKLSPALSLEISGLYQKTDNKQLTAENKTLDQSNKTNEDNESVAAYSPRLLGYFKASYEGHKFIAALTGTYVGNMLPYWDKTIGNGSESAGARIGQRVPGYFNLGLNLRLEDIVTHGVFVNLRIANLLDAEIRYPTFTNNPWADLGTLGRGLNFLLSAGIKF